MTKHTNYLPFSSIRSEGPAHALDHRIDRLTTQKEILKARALYDQLATTPELAKALEELLGFIEGEVLSSESEYRVT